MCIYISAIVPKSADINRVAAIAACVEKDFRPFANASIQSQLDSGEGLFLTTRGHCDCDTAIGSGNLTRRKVTNIEDERSKLAKKGWSKSKVERTLSQRIEKIQKREEDQNSKLGKDLENWLVFLRTAISSKDMPYIALLTHHYSGNVLAEEFEICGRKIIHLSELSKESLANIPENLIYQVSAHA